MSLDFSFINIENWKEVVWLDIPKDDPDWDQKRLEHDHQTGRGDYLREDPKDDTSPFVKYKNPVSDILVWACLEIQIGEITEKNYQEFWMRMAMADGAYGEGRYKEYIAEKKDWVPRGITIEEVYQHIGLKTNVFPKMSTTKWYNSRLRNVPEAKQAKAKKEAA